MSKKNKKNKPDSKKEDNNSEPEVVDIITPEEVEENTGGSMLYRNLIFIGAGVVIIIVLGVLAVVLSNNSNPPSNDEIANSDSEQVDNDSNTEENSQDTNTEDENPTDTNSDDANTAENNTDNGSLNGDGISTSTEQNSSDSLTALKTGHSLAGWDKSLANQNRINASGQWGATDYGKGDIIGQNYTIQLGDTLWEIADGYYGNGFTWNQILEHNKALIGYLPNGEQALIFPEQIIAIP